MFSADSELAEEDFIQAALLIENDFIETAEVVAIEKQLISNTPVLTGVSVIGFGHQGDHFVGASVSEPRLVPESTSVFSLSQDFEFDDDLSDDILFNQVTAYSNSLTDNEGRSLEAVRKSVEIGGHREMKSDGCVVQLTGNVSTRQLQPCSSLNPESVGCSVTATARKDLSLSSSRPVNFNLGRLGEPVKVASVHCRESPIARKRKFPGPAGVLPKLKSGLLETGLLALTGDKNENPGQPKESGDVIVLSQSSVDDFFVGNAWRSMLEDLEPDADRILSRFSARSVIEMATARQLVHGKVPVFCAVIESVSARGADACVTLVDPTGKISGTVHRELIKEYTTCFQAGTVIVLRQVSLLSPLGRNYYLNITPNNVVRLYPRGDEPSNPQSAIKLRELSKDDLEYAVPPPRPQVTPIRPELTAVRPAVRHPVPNVTPSNSSSSSARFSARPERPRVSEYVTPSYTSAVRPQTFGGLQRQSTPVSKVVATNDRRSLFVARDASNGLPIESSFRAPFTSGGLSSQVHSGARLGADSRTQSMGSKSSDLGPVGPAASSGTPRFTFKRALTMHESPIVDRVVDGSVGTPLSKGVVVASMPLGDRSNKDGSQIASKKNEPSSADIWKLEDIDDDMLLNLSTEFMSDF